MRAEQLVPAIALLPPCDRTAPPMTDVVILVAELGGRVRVTFSRFEHKRGRLHRWFWTPNGLNA